jgi:WD40 repeat protein
MVTNTRIVFIGFILNVMCLSAMEKWGKDLYEDPKPVTRGLTRAQAHPRGNEAHDDEKMTEMSVFRSDNDIVGDPSAFQKQRHCDPERYWARLKADKTKKLCSDLERICLLDAHTLSLGLLKGDIAETIVGKFARKVQREKYIQNVLKGAESIESRIARNYIATAQGEYVITSLKGVLQEFILNHNAVGKCVKLTKTLKTGDVAAIDCSPNGQAFVVGDFDGDVRIYTMDGACIKKLSNEEPVRSIRFSPDGKTIAAWFVGGCIKRWDTESGKLIKDVKFNFKVHDSHQNTRVISFSPDTSCIASTCNGENIKIWDIDSAECMIIEDTAYALCFYPDGSRIVYATPTEIKVMHLESRKCLRTIPYNTGPNDYRLLSLSHDGLLLAVSGNEYERLPDGELQYVASGDGINVYDILSEPRRVMSTESGLTCLNPIYFSPKERLFVSWDDEQLKLWDIGSKQCTNLKSHDDEITAVCFSRERDNIFSSSEDGVTLIHKLENFKATFKLSSFLFLLHFVHNDGKINKDIPLSAPQKELISLFSHFIKSYKG